MKKHLEYLKKLLRHKWFTLQECRRLGITWLGLIHDWSKFLPSEWGPYVEWFHGERIVLLHMTQEYKRGDWAGGYVVTSYDRESMRLECVQAFVKEAFDAAWNHHQKSNKHHWQYWCLTQDDDPDLALPMPDRYRREMLADWRGASRAYTGSDNTRKWYLERREKMTKRLHPETRAWIEEQLGVDD
jgi:hypothetical protein